MSTFTQEQMDAAIAKATLDATNAATTANASANAASATAERERVSGIVNCEEAKGRTNLANHLAFNTSMSVADAQAMLKVSAQEAPAATTEKPKENANGSPFSKVMDNAEHPNQGADEGDDKGKNAETDGLAAAMMSVAGKSYEK